MSRRLTAVAVVALIAALGATAAHAKPVVTSGTGPDPAALQATVDSFRAQLGALNANTAGSRASGRREINWDDVPDSAASPNDLPPDYFNTTSPRGVLLTKFDGSGVVAQVSADSSNPTNTPTLFGNIDPSYPTIFQAFSAERIFGVTDPTNFYPTNTYPVDIVFRVPGSAQAATTSAFGAVFTGVGGLRGALTFYDENGHSLGQFSAPGTAGKDLSFVGVRFDAGERVGLVQIDTGDATLAPGHVDAPGNHVIAMDDFIYGEPQPLATSGESFESGSLGSFTAATQAGQPGDPTWSVTQSDAHTGSHSVFVPDPGHNTDMTLTSGPVDIGTGGPSRLTFFQRMSSEPHFDGGVVEISTDGGVWTAPPLGQYLEASPDPLPLAGNSPLAGREAWNGASFGWQRTILDLTPYAGHRIRYRFRFASNDSGPWRGWWLDDLSVTTPPSPPTTTPPPPAVAIRALQLQPASFAAARRGASIARKRTAVGSTLRFRLTRDASVTFTVQHKLTGRRQGRSCKAPSAHNRHGKRCVRYVAVRGSFSISALAGLTTRPFTGRVGGHALAPGRYRLVATARVDGTKAATRFAFKIVRAR